MDERKALVPEASEPRRQREQRRKAPAEGSDHVGDGRREPAAGAGERLRVDGAERRAHSSDSKRKHSHERRDPSSKAPRFVFL